MPNSNQGIRLYLREYLPLYTFVFVLFVTGVVFGAVMVNALTLEQKQELARHLSSFFQMINVKTGGNEIYSFQQSFSLHMKWVVLIWVLGLSVIGLPLIFALDFLKGVLVGFTVGYMVAQYSWKGMLFAFVSVVPQNLVAVPAIIVCSAGAGAFSIFLVKNRLFNRRGSVYSSFMRYSATVLGMALLLAGVSLYEAYLSPELMRLVTPMLL